MTNQRSTFFALALALAFGCSALAQPLIKPKATTATTPPACRADGPVDGLTLKTANLSIFDRSSGRTIGTLAAEDFILREDGVEREIGRAGRSRTPLSVVILIDTSPSRSNRLSEIARAANTIMRGMAPTDTLSVITFDGVINHLVNKKKVSDISSRDINIARSTYGTRLYDAVDSALKAGFATGAERKVMILFTDGEDNSSKNLGADESVKAVHEADLTVFSMQYDVQGLTRRNKYLEQLSAETGGKLYLSEDFKEFGAGVASILDEVASQYTLCYWSPSTVANSVSVKLRSAPSGTYAIRMIGR